MERSFAEIIETELKRRGASPITTALAAGLNRDAIRSVLRGRAPSIDRAAEICAVLDLEFYIGPPRDDAVAPPAADSFARFDPTIDMTVIGWAKCSPQGALEEEREFPNMPAPVDIRAYDEDSFHAIAKGRSMVPEGIRPGDYCLASPNTEPTPGVRVWFKDRDGRATIKRLVDFDNETYSPRG